MAYSYYKVGCAMVGTIFVCCSIFRRPQNGTDSKTVWARDRAQEPPQFGSRTVAPEKKVAGQFRDSQGLLKCWRLELN